MNTVYNVNRGIGWASSGVEYAQAYRSKIFSQLGVRTKFIFTDFFERDNIEYMTKNIGFADEDVIWLYLWFTDFSVAKTTFTPQDLEEKLDGEFEKSTINDTIVYNEKDRKHFVTAYLTKDGKAVQRVEDVFQGCLLTRDYYSYGKYCTEYFTPENGRAKLRLRRWFNIDGSTAYEEIIDGEDILYKMRDALLYSKEAFVGYFFKKLHLDKSDMLIIDRSTDIARGALANRGKAKVSVVVHAEHFSENNTTRDNILWNNFYEYTFRNADKIDYYICSTEVQTKLLKKHFRRYQRMHPKVVTIPVGSVDTLLKPTKERKRYSLMTASRLAPEKHIDWLVTAAVKAKKSVPDLTLDIYGSGKDAIELEKLIDENGAKDYIRLMGHYDLITVYPKYEAYITASTSEGFGLTLLEAISAGLPMIGIDVRYGNTTFIHNEINGFLIPLQEDGNNEMIDGLAKAMVRLFTEVDIKTFSRASYMFAKPYMTEELVDTWRRFLVDACGENVFKKEAEQ